MKKYISFSLSLILFLVTLITFFTLQGKYSQKAYFGKEYAVIRVMEEDRITPLEISGIRYAVEEASHTVENGNGRLWCDAYSYFETAFVSREDSKTLECQAVVTGGDYFLFHNLEFVNGYYYSDTDLNLDRVVIDEKLAFELFGSNNAEGMTVVLGDKTYYVAGVVSLEENKAREIQLGDTPVIFIPQNIGETLYGTRDYDVYEVMMQNDLPSYAFNTVSAVCEGKDVIDVTHRFDLKNIIKIIGQFPSRSFVTNNFSYPYYENADRGREDVLSILLVLNAVTFVIFAVNTTILIYKLRRKR